MKIRKLQKFAANLYNKTENVTHIRSLKQTIDQLKAREVTKLNQKTWLKQYIDINTDLRKAAKNDFQKQIFILKNNSVFGKTIENFQKHRGFKLLTTERRRNYLLVQIYNLYY